MPSLRDSTQRNLYGAKLPCAIKINAGSIRVPIPLGPSRRFPGSRLSRGHTSYCLQVITTDLSRRHTSYEDLSRGHTSYCLFWAGTGSVGHAFGVDLAGRVDTTFDQGQVFSYGIKMTAEASGDLDAISYTIDHLINGVSILNEVNQVGNFAPSNRDTAGFIQDQGGTNWQADGLKLSIVSAVPEPTAAVAFGLMGLVVLARRRRA